MFSIALRPRKLWGSLGRTAQDGHLDSHTATELWQNLSVKLSLISQASHHHQPLSQVERKKKNEKKTKAHTGFIRSSS